MKTWACGFCMVMGAAWLGCAGSLTSSVGAPVDDVHSVHACRTVADATRQSDEAIQEGNWGRVTVLTDTTDDVTDRCGDAAVVARYRAVRQRGLDGLARWRGAQARQIAAVHDAEDYRAAREAIRTTDLRQGEVERQLSVAHNAYEATAANNSARRLSLQEDVLSLEERLQTIRAASAENRRLLVEVLRGHGYDEPAARALGLIQ